MRIPNIPMAPVRYVFVATLLLISSAASGQADGPHAGHTECPAHSHTHPASEIGAHHVIRFAMGSYAQATRHNAHIALRAHNTTLEQRVRLSEAQLDAAIAAYELGTVDINGKLIDATTFVRYAPRAEYIVGNDERSACTRVRLRIRDTWSFIAHTSDTALMSCRMIRQRCHQLVDATDGFESVLPLSQDLSTCEALAVAIDDVIAYARTQQ